MAADFDSEVLDSIPDMLPPQRVISLAPNITETLFDLHLGQRLIGITEQCPHHADRLIHLPRLGEPWAPDITRIITLAPDLVLLNRDINRQQDASHLIDAGIPIWITGPQTVGEAINLLWNMMTVFAEPSATERVRWIERQMDWTAAAAQREPARTILIGGHTPWSTVPATSYTLDLLRICGGQSVSSASKPPFSLSYQEITLNEIAALSPEVILLANGVAIFAESEIEVLSRLDMPAAINGRIHIVDGTLLTWPGTRVARAFAEIAPLLAIEGRRGTEHFPSVTS